LAGNASGRPFYRVAVMESLTVPAALESLPSIGRSVLDAAQRAGLERGRAYRLRLAVDEIATNIIVHGRTADPIVMYIGVGDSTLTIALEDSGPPFDPMSLPEPAGLDQPLESRTPGGLGTFLATHGVDRFHYERIGGRNRNVFTMDRPASR
jgi:serine/threonine-protein kinase RsbW